MSNINDLYTQIESSVALAGLEISASEVHGTLVGAISNHMKSGVTPNLLQLVEPQADANDGRLSQLADVLYQVYRDTSELLIEVKEGFDLVVPDDSDPIESRVEGLATWTKGYLLGLLYNDSFSIDQLPESAPEIVRDFIEISEAGAGQGNAQEEDFALAELHEYVKVGAQLVFEFIYSERASEAPTQTQ